MQNKGFVKLFALLLTVVCLIYLSFTAVTSYHTNKAEACPQGSQHYLDSIKNKKVWLGVYTFEQCRKLAIALDTSMDYLADLTDEKKPYLRKESK